VQAAARTRARAGDHAPIASLGTYTVATLAAVSIALQRNRMIIAGANEGIAGQPIGTDTTHRAAASPIATRATGRIGDGGQATAAGVAQNDV
jgi:hypothetical protein